VLVLLVLVWLLTTLLGGRRRGSWAVLSWIDRHAAESHFNRPMQHTGLLKKDRFSPKVTSPGATTLSRPYFGLRLGHLVV
jgi:hypothetical protein